MVTPTMSYVHKSYFSDPFKLTDPVLCIISNISPMNKETVRYKTKVKRGNTFKRRLHSAAVFPRYLSSSFYNIIP